MFNGWLRGYEWIARQGAQIQVVMLLVTLGTMVGTVYLYIIIPKGFFPIEDTGFISVTVEGPADISFHAMRERQHAIAAIVRAGSGGRLRQFDGRGRRPELRPPTTGRMFVALKPKTERGPSGAGDPAAAPHDRPVAGMEVYFREIQNINIGGRISKGEFQYTHAVERHRDALPRVATRCATRSRPIEGLRDVNTDLYIKNPQIEIEIDREKAAFYGITPDQIRQELYNAFGNRQVATIYTPINDYQVILETQPEFQADTSACRRSI